MEEIPLIMNRVAGQRSWLALGLEALFLQPPGLSKSAHWSPEKIEKAVLASLEKAELRVRPYFTEGSRFPATVAKSLAKEGKRLIIAAGGDGTINEVANGLVGTETRLGIIPLGTANTFANELGIPLSVEAAAQVIRNGHERTVDVGKVGGRHFVMGAGLGFDAEVIRKVPPDLKRFLGQLAYLLIGNATALTYSFPELVVDVEPAAPEHTGYLVIVSNARFYGGSFRVAPRASLEDGLLDVLVMKRKKIWNLWAYAATTRYGDVTKLPDVEYFQCRRVEISSDPPVPIHVDAELAGETPCEFECVPASLRVIVP